MFPEFWQVPLVNWTIKSYGFMLMVAFFSAAYLAARRAEKVRANPDVVLNCSILALVGSLVGARLFYVVHYWEARFASLENPLAAILDISSGGMELFGGVIGGALAILAYLLLKGLSIRWYFDIITPSLMLGLTFGRLGCFLNGCCWGGLCAGDVSQQWSVRFPYGSPVYHRQYAERQIKVPAELLHAVSPGQIKPLGRDLVFVDPLARRKYARLLDEAQRQYAYVSEMHPGSPAVADAESKLERYRKLAAEEARKFQPVNANLRAYPSEEFPGLSMTPYELADLARASNTLAVHPAQMYSAINAFLAYLFLAAVFRVRRRHGMVFALWLLTYPWTRVVLEQIRVDNPRDTFGLTVSSSISVLMIASGAVLALWLRLLPPVSPAARPHEPPEPTDGGSEDSP